MLPPENHSLSNKSSMTRYVEAPETLGFIAILLVSHQNLMVRYYSLYLITGYDKIRLVLTWKTLPCYLPFTVLEDAMKASHRESY